MRARLTSRWRSTRGPVGHGSQLDTEAVPQITTRAPTRELGQHGVADAAGGIVEIDVDPARAGGLQRFGDVAGLVVDRRVVAEFSRHSLPLTGPPVDADRAAAHELGDLPDRRADRAGGGRHHHRIARPRLAEIEQAEIGGEAVQPEHAERQRQRQIGFARPCARSRSVGDRIVLPAELAHHPVALGVAGWREAITLPAAKERITSPMRDRAANSWRLRRTQPRMAGSTERNSLRTRNLPARPAPAPAPRDLEMLGLRNSVRPRSSEGLGD